MNKRSFTNYIKSLLPAVLILVAGCKKIVEVPQPDNSITTSEVFSNAATATSAVTGIYSDMVSNKGIVSGSGFTTVSGGLSADELIDFATYNTDFVELQNNKLLSTNSVIYNTLWLPTYFDIYMANGVIQGLASSTSIAIATKNQLTGEAEFLRAFNYFYLVNNYGGVPLATTTAYAQTATLPRASTSQVYNLIIADLKNAQSLLPADYSGYGSQRVRATKWAATALLARVYLYNKNWASADSAATVVINNSSLYSLVPDLNSVFLANSNEAILQLIPNGNSEYATPEGESVLPFPLNTGNPQFYLTPQLLSAFEPGDNRRTAWVDSTIYLGTTYYFPYKYKVPYATSDNIPEYDMLLRLAEMYLIRAEADANGAGKGTAEAITDLNYIRKRAGLPALPAGLNSTQVLAAVVQENRIEFFSEWGHRFFDLKRTGTASTVLSAISYKKPWDIDQLLYPIPQSEVFADPEMKQNPGY